MAWQFSILQLPPLLATILSLGLFRTVWDHRDQPLSQAFLLFVAGILVWSLCYTLQLGFTNIEAKLLADKLLYIGAVTVPTAWLVLTARYAGRDDWLTHDTWILLALEPIAMLGLVATNPWHNLIYQEATLAQTARIPLLTMEYGPAYWVNLAYSYILVLVGIAFVLDVLLRGRALYRRQATLLLGGAIPPLVANSLFATGQSPLAQVDLTTFAFAITGSVVAIALFEFDLLSRTPVARRRMSDAMGDGFIVLDEHDHVVDYNDIATQIFGDPLDTDATLTDLFNTTDLDTVDGTELEATVGDTTHHYEVKSLPLDGRHDTGVGHLIALREITDRKAYEQRLEVANRLLRHNLRTDSNLILGYATNLQQKLDDEDLDQIVTAARRLADLSRKATHLETTVHQTTVEPTTVDAATTARTVTDRFRQSHPDTTITTDLPDTAPVNTLSEDLLETALANLLENAIEHTDRDPRIDITITVADSVNIAVADNGPGIPDMERDVLAAGRETPLEHGSGLGLWLVRWITEESGGQITFQENEPRGSIVTLELPPG